MKVFVFVFALLGVLLASANHNDPAYWRMVRKGVEAKIVLTVVDDLGSPVPDAAVHAIFSKTTDLDPFDGKTDVHGKCEFQHLTNGNSLEFFVAKDGYYESRIKFSLIKMGSEHRIDNERWQPWPMCKRIVLRKIRSPVKLQRISKTLNSTVTNCWIGVDMKIGDFIAPYGAGKYSDFELQIHWDGMDFLKSKLCVANIRFPQPFAGGYFATKVQESSFPHVYAADTNLITVQEFCVQTRLGEFYSSHRPFPPESTFVTRTRCEVDSYGRLKNSNYGCVRQLDVSPGDVGVNGVVVYLYSIFNPTPNDTNLEPKSERAVEKGCLR